MLASQDTERDRSPTIEPARATAPLAETSASSNRAGMSDPLSASNAAQGAALTMWNGTDDHGKEGEGGEHLAELLWCKSAVYLNPSLTAAPTAGLPGFLAIVRTKKEHGGWSNLISWIPEKLVEGTRDFDAFVLVELSSRMSTCTPGRRTYDQSSCAADALTPIQRTSAMCWCTCRRRRPNRTRPPPLTRRAPTPSLTRSRPSTRCKFGHPP